MIKTHYNIYKDKDRNYDPIFPKIIDSVKEKVSIKDDDVLFLAVGDTGSGKSMLMLHAYEYFAGEHADIKYIGFTREDFADSLNECRKLPKGVRFVGNDEANINKREALTKWNRELLDLYYSIRGLNIFHWWSNPSVDMIDKPFIKDRVKGLFLITTKDINKPRIYFYFKKSKLLQIYEKYGNLDIKTIKKVRGAYASYRGWFKDYTGFLKQDYLNKKNPRMVDKVRDFVLKYGNKKTANGEKVYDKHTVANMLHYSPSTIANFLKSCNLDTGVICREDIVDSGSTKKFLKEKAVLKLYAYRVTKGHDIRQIVDPEIGEFLERRCREEGLL